MFCGLFLFGLVCLISLSVFLYLIVLFPELPNVGVGGRVCLSIEWLVVWYNLFWRHHIPSLQTNAIKRFAVAAGEP